MPNYIAYYRVSTTKQGVSGLGMEAQKESVHQFIGSSTLVREYVEVESGKSHMNRPQLALALADCKKRKATLVIAKLDRLARNVHFISGLMESGVEFVAVDNPHATKLTLHILAAIAEHEREMISTRTKEALAQVKASLEILGERTSKAGRVYRKLGNPRLEAARESAANTNRAHIPPETLGFIRMLREQKLSYRAVAVRLNENHIPSGRGGLWHAKTVRAVALR